MEEEQENKERGGEQWVNYKDEALEEMYTNEKLPVEPERERLLMRLKKQSWLITRKWRDTRKWPPR